MRVITEAILRAELKINDIKDYYIPEGKILSPAAREYLLQKKIKIKEHIRENKRAISEDTEAIKSVDAAKPPRKYTDYISGAYYDEKPEYMTQLRGNVLVNKNHPRIKFRGALDTLNSLVVMNQVLLSEISTAGPIVKDLEDVYSAIIKIMRADVLNEDLEISNIIGYTHAEIRERSHYPERYFKVKQMILPEYKYGKEYALLNQIRTSIRTCEVLGNEAFFINGSCERPDIIQTLNRLSSVLHIMMCKFLGGYYK